MASKTKTAAKPKAAATKTTSTASKPKTASKPSKAKKTAARKAAATRQESKKETQATPAVGNVSATHRRRPVVVNNRTVRSDQDALEGHFCQVVAGPHDGIFGTFIQVEEREEDGYPKTILVKNRDWWKDVDLVTVNYKDVRPAVTGGRRDLNVG